MDDPFIDKEYLINLRFPKSTAQDIIRQTKPKLVKQGFSVYNNKRLGRVPKSAVESILGCKLP
ncbi:MAG: DUF3173 domain-containing protein [Lactobacillaceae bacterium]|nr:DUF3173 domain-containing protein [Lactobacillaceae bacterium]